MSAAMMPQATRFERVELRGDVLRLAEPGLWNAEVCVEGPAGTGKTRAILEYVHFVLRTFPNTRALITRKTNVDLAGSVMNTFREEVVKPWHRIQYFSGSKVRPPGYQYPNGSLLTVTGLDRIEKVKSYAWNLAYLNEATELTVDDLEFIRSRLGRDERLPFWQLLLDCNPAGPQHWLKKRLDEGRTVRLISRHEDNPAFYDLERQQFTPLGERYITETLGGLTGVRRLRLLQGIWAAAEGLVYDEWDAARHIVAPFPLPRTWPRYLSIDWGMENPAVVQWWADSGETLYCYRELYQTGWRVDQLAHEVVKAMGYYREGGRLRPVIDAGGVARCDPLPVRVFADHDKSDRATFEHETGLFTTPAYKDIAAGIQAVKRRLANQPHQPVRIAFFRDALVRRDVRLIEKKRPCGTLEEIESYVWDTRTAASELKETPVDRDNHGMDALRYLVATLDGKPHKVTVTRFRTY